MEMGRATSLIETIAKPPLWKCTTRISSY